MEEEKGGRENVSVEEKMEEMGKRMKGKKGIKGKGRDEIR